MADLAALEERYRERENHADWRTALIVCAALNPHVEKPLQPADIMPWLKPKADAEPRPAVTRELLEDCNAALGGTAKIIGST